MGIGLGFFAIEPANLLAGGTAPPPGAFLAQGQVSERNGWTGGRSKSFTCPSSSLHRPRPRPVTERLCMHDFSSSAYWNAVYASGEDESGQKAVAEWHVDGDVVVQAVERLVGIPPSRREEPAVLNIGCGKSTLSERLYDQGWRNITNIDFSTTCVEQGRSSPSSQSRPGLKWLVMDACSMNFDDDSFDVAVDKGTLDAIACSEAFDWFLPRMARSVARVLRPGGTWVCVSFTPPEIALPLLEECEGWRVHVERLEEELFWMYVGRKLSAAASDSEMN